MSFEIISRSVCTTYTLEPAIRALNLRVPTILGVMSHLVCKMLTESEAILIDSQFRQKQVSPCNEVTQGFVVYNTL
jgi:phosphohistidine swiveling domain-containing protein